MTRADPSGALLQQWREMTPRAASGRVVSGSLATGLAFAPVLPAALNLGRRPMFYAEANVSLLESHLLDFDGDLYDEAARVQFVAYLRPELTFESVDALIAQIGRDCDEARAILSRS